MIVVSYDWALWLPFLFDSSVGVGSLGLPRAPSLAQDLVQVVFNKYLSSNLSGCVLRTEESKEPRALSSYAHNHFQSMKLRGKSSEISWQTKAPASKPDELDLWEPQ